MQKTNPWQKNKPLFIQAPMEDVTDTVFRRVLVRCGAPDIFFTEFTNVEGLRSVGRDRVIHRLHFTEAETPLIAQLWGDKPENYYSVAKELREPGFAGIDINMGCPVRKKVRRGACSGLINFPNHASEIIKATQEGAGDLPVSVKTRCGVATWVTEEWISHLLSHNLAAITLHGRIAKELSHFPARWDQIALAVKLRDELAPDTLLIGNGDVDSYQDGLEKMKTYSVDGVMIGRGIFANPWIFDPTVDPESIGIEERMDLLSYHVRLFEETWGNSKNFHLLKKFFKIYVHGLPNARELRDTLVRVENVDEALRVAGRLAASGA